jgi:Flp pilus assembly protein TadD, contains TPR repeats
MGLATGALAQAPTVESLLQRAVERGRQGDFEAAILALNQVIQLAPTNATAFTLRGVAYTNLGNAKQALADFTKAIELAPKAAAAYGYRSVVRRQLQDLPGALADVNEAIKIDSKNPGFIPFAGHCTWMRGIGPRPSAIFSRRPNCLGNGATPKG